jgi:polyribonucleotide nucleotidyltransferase
MIQRIERQFAGRPLILEIGRMAKLAGGSCLVQYGDTVVLCAATVQAQADPPPVLPAHGRVPGEVLRRREDPRRILQA